MTHLLNFSWGTSAGSSKGCTDVSRQISSGKRITKPSDAPDQIAPLLQLRANLLRNQQIQANMAVSKAIDDTAEGAIGSAGKLLDRALALASQALSFSQNISGWPALADQVQSLQEQMLTSANLL